MIPVRCQFEFKCDQAWEELECTSKDNVRFCKECEKNVYWADSEEELFGLAEKGLCAATQIDETFAVGGLKLVHRSEIPEEQRIYDLKLAKQEVTNKKLMHYKREMLPNSSLTEIREIFMNAPYVILHGAHFHECLRMEELLKAYGIETEFRDEY